jgi:GNAT superfamily N-acetyltransferase
MSETIRLKHLPPGSFDMTYGLPAAELIRRTFWNTDVTKPQHAGRLTSRNHLVVAHDAPGEVLATGTLTMENESQGYIDNVVTAPGCRGLGLGTAVLEYLEGIAADEGAQVVHLKAVPQVQPFYEQLGYELSDTPATLAKVL